MEQPAPDIFDRHRRRARRGIARGADFIGQQITEALLERLALVTRGFTRALVLGGRSSTLVAALQDRGMTVDVAEPAGGAGLAADPDHLDVAPGSYDLVLWPGGLESVNDVPGALLRVRFALRPDGLLLGALIGDGSLPMLRAALREGAIAADRPIAARMHPQIALQAMGALLQGSGFALPVVDVDALDLRYRSIGGLVRDLRSAAVTALLAGPVPPLTRTEWAATAAAFAAAGEGATTVETLRIIHFSGWAPDASQPRPARRGSATASLAAALAVVKDQPAS
jgi:SAM-dependent methyltransferase